MPESIKIELKESTASLKALHSKCAPQLKPRLKMLVALSTGITSVNTLAAKTGVSTGSIRIWKKKYRTGGLEALTTEGRGGDHRSGITEEQKQKISAKLTNPKDALRSYKEAQDWLKEELGIEKAYQAINKYLKRNFGTKLKVGRKSHVKKDEAAIAVFKNPARSAKTH